MWIIIKTPDNQVLEVDSTRCYVGVVFSPEEKKNIAQGDGFSIMCTFPENTPEGDRPLFVEKVKEICHLSDQIS